MSERKTPFLIGEYYHIYNRGNSKQEIYLDELDYDRFTKMLYLCNSNKSIRFKEDIVEKEIDAFDFDKGEEIVSIGSWVLMPNHFHIYLTISPRSCLGERSIPVFLQKLSTGYSMYFNKKYQRSGSLFEGKFKSQYVNEDSYSKYIFSYIHLNPLKLIQNDWKEVGIKDKLMAKGYLEKYNWSSYLDYLGIKRKENKIISSKNFPDYFPNVATFTEEVFDWINFSSQGLALGKGEEK